jgi:hypothetical protein
MTTFSNTKKSSDRIKNGGNNSGNDDGVGNGSVSGEGTNRTRRTSRSSSPIVRSPSPPSVTIHREFFDTSLCDITKVERTVMKTGVMTLNGYFLKENQNLEEKTNFEPKKAMRKLTQNRIKEKNNSKKIIETGELFEKGEKNFRENQRSIEQRLLSGEMSRGGSPDLHRTSSASSVPNVTSPPSAQKLTSPQQLPLVSRSSSPSKVRPPSPSVISQSVKQANSTGRYSLSTNPSLSVPPSDDSSRSYSSNILKKDLFSASQGRINEMKKNTV